MFSSWTVTVYNLDWVGRTFSFARITGTLCWLQQLMLEQTNFVQITINNHNQQSTILCESQSAVVARFANHLVPVANLRQISLILFVFVIFWIELSPFWCRHSLHRSRHHRARNRNPAWRDLRTCCSPSPFTLQDQIKPDQTIPERQAIQLIPWGLCVCEVLRKRAPCAHGLPYRREGMGRGLKGRGVAVEPRF